MFFMAFGPADVDGKAVIDLRHETTDLGIHALCLQLDPAVGEVADKAADFKLLGYLQRLVTKTHSLHVTAEKYGEMQDFHGGCWTGRSHYQRRN